MTVELGKTSFVCPHCRVLAQQNWFTVLVYSAGSYTLSAMDDIEDHTAGASARQAVVDTATNLPGFKTKNMAIGSCNVCRGSTIWFQRRLIYPIASEAPLPNPDMPASVAADYDEAARVLPHSPRAASALLRLALEKLCGHLLNSDASINDMIADFVKLGVPPQVSTAMDVLRVTGNEAVHPGKMTDVDDAETARALFGLLNIIVEVLISQPKHVASMYEKLPAEKRAGIETRNQRLLPGGG